MCSALLGTEVAHATVATVRLSRSISFSDSQSGCTVHLNSATNQLPVHAWAIPCFQGPSWICHVTASAIGCRTSRLTDTHYNLYPRSLCCLTYVAGVLCVTNRPVSEARPARRTSARGRTQPFLRASVIIRTSASALNKGEVVSSPGLYGLGSLPVHMTAIDNCAAST